MNPELEHLYRSTGQHPLIHSCSIYYKSKNFFIISNTEIQNGSIGSEPVFHTKELREIGDLVMRSLAAQGHWPDYVIGPGYDPDELMKPYGFKKWTIFTRGTVYIPVIQQGDKLRLKKHKPRGGRVLGLTTDPRYYCDPNPKSIVSLVAQLLELPDPFAE